ncbi:Arc family DNA-binding protein [Delftia acidovorans]|uniref:Arc family DNA-binding protein n=1 Tax=Delftia acidovorans TaxID=80866 RepID=UPI000F828E92|nr:Arc family DNA-binding protein [Delftia acidovorans]
MTEQSKQERSVAVRLPAELRAYMQQAAKANFRSLSSELAARIERSHQEDRRHQQGAAA